MSNKRYDARLKADGDEGKFSAIVSVFGNVDRQGDRVVKGAFLGSIARLRAIGDPLPVVWSHDWSNPSSIIGRVDPRNIEETDLGLLVRDAEIDMDNPIGVHVFELLKSRTIKQFSFAYDVLREQAGGGGANDLLELELFECGPCLRGANELTQLVGTKSTSALELPLTHESLGDGELIHALLVQAKEIYATSALRSYASGGKGEVSLTPEEKADVDRLLRQSAELRQSELAEQAVQREIDRRAREFGARPTKAHEQRTAEIEVRRLAERLAALRPADDPVAARLKTWANDGQFADALARRGFDAGMVKVAMGGETAQETADRVREEKRAKALEDYRRANAALLAGPIPGADDERARLDEYNAHEAQDRAARDAARKSESDRIDAAAEEARRLAPIAHGGKGEEQ